MSEKNSRIDYARLTRPFTPDEIQWRVGSTNKDKTKGLALAYIDARAIMKRLDEEVGVMGWQDEYSVQGSITICRLGIQVRPGEWLWKSDGAGESNTEGEKGSISGALKRAAVKWGIGRYLYDLPATWVKIEQYGKSYRLAETPRLPSWALPTGSQKQPKPPKSAAQASEELGYGDQKGAVWTEAQKQAVERGYPAAKGEGHRVAGVLNAMTRAMNVKPANIPAEKIEKLAKEYAAVRGENKNESTDTLMQMAIQNLADQKGK